MHNEDSFYAINKLVDFAKSTAIQKQMTASMNETIVNMRIPGVDNPMREAAQNPKEEISNED
ncbi:MAG: hypothetical protein LBC83_01400 [Oscillospiraceae bacterium]|jgi:hypothetical protein|nr:hypothetical protein [Oscillospiraceae bacterium]